MKLLKLKQKKYFFWMLVILLIPSYVNAKIIPAGEEYESYDKAQETVKEVMKQYYIKGPYFQYNYAKATYATESPEEATSQDNKYAVCAAYTYDVYGEAFGMYYSSTSKFPRYNYNIVESAYDKYYKDNKNLDGNFLVYYESTTSENGVYTDNSVARPREITKYVFGDSDLSTDKGDFETLVNNVKPGDLFFYSGHALIAYDVVINPNTNKKDVLILNSTADEYIRTRIDGTSKLSYNFFKSPYGNNGYLDIEEEGSFQWLWLSNSSHFVKDGELKCKDEECAVIRPFYNKNGKAVFNFDIETSQYAKGKLRTEYPGLFIEKTVNVNDNNSVYIGDTLKYSIKIINKSNKTITPQKWNEFIVEENIPNYVEYVSSNNNAIIKDNKIVWKIDKLSSGDIIELEYIVKVKDDYNNILKDIEAIGNFYSENKKDVLISTGTVKNKIIPKITKLNNSYSDCFSKNKDKYSGIELINEIYICATGNDFGFNLFSFNNLFIKSGTKKSNVKINFKSDLDEVHSNIKNMILNNYFSGLLKVNSYYYLPPLRGSASALRAKTINPDDFKEGDILLYNIESSKFTDEDGMYAYIYIDGKFVGINGKDASMRNQFDYKYYELANEVTSSICSKYDYSLGAECNYAYNLYGGYTKLGSLSSEIQTEVLEFVNYQTLFDKDYYMILRPEIIMKELSKIEVEPPTKKNYIQNLEELDLMGGLVTLIYNDGSNEVLDLSDENIKLTGFDNTKVGINKIKLEYEDYSAMFEVEIISDEIADNDNADIDIENPETGSFLPLIMIGFGIIIALSVFVISRKKNKFYKI